MGIVSARSSFCVLHSALFLSVRFGVFLFFLPMHITTGYVAVMIYGRLRLLGPCILRLAARLEAVSFQLTADQSFTKPTIGRTKKSSLNNTALKSFERCVK